MAATAAAAAVVSAAAAAVSAGVGIYSATQQKELSEKNYEQQLKSYQVDFEDRISTFRSELDDSIVEQNQLVSDVGSQYDYLAKWQSYADQQMNAARGEAEEQWLQAATSYAGQLTASSEMGHVGGSSSLLSASSRRKVASLVGDSLTLNEQEGTLGMQLSALKGDLRTERQNALSQLSTSKAAALTQEGAIKDYAKSLDTTTKALKDVNEALGDL